MVIPAVLASGACWLEAVERSPQAPVVFYASQGGKSTLDQGEGGGNPFASALIELLDRPSLSYSELRADLIALTIKKSRGFQQPDVSTTVDSTQWSVKPVPASPRRVALVFVYSDYSNAGVSSLAGAERDLGRVATALKGAGFSVETAADPTEHDLHAALDALARESERAEAAVIYTTGHGFEHGGQVYLAPNDYPFDEGPERLGQRGVHVPALGDHLKAVSANLVFYGGCRTYW